VKKLLIGIVVIVAILWATARIGLWPVNATATPPQFEAKLGQSVLQASLNRQAKGLTNPIQPTNDALLAGMKLFKTNCAGCHGEPGRPSQWGTRGFYPRVPQFGDRPPALSAPQMFVAIKQGIRYSGMGAWDGMMPDEDIWKVATFLERIGSLPPEVEANWKSTQ
jgi:mono/diheme cytochrome c family protein